MDLSWTQEASAQFLQAQRFAERQLASRRCAAEFDRLAWAECGRAGYLGGPLPEAWGGRATDSLTTAATFEALGRGGADRGLLFAIGAHLFGCARSVARFGSAAQHERWGKGLADGSLIAALTATEPAGGSSISRMATLAEPVADGYRIRGGKTCITNAPVADLFLLIASESPQRGALGLTAFLVPRDTPGLHVKPLSRTLGMHGAPMAEVIFDNCTVGRDAVLGRAGGGFAVLSHAMQHERTCILAGFLGAAQRDLAACVTRARRRGDPIIEHQAVSHRLARMKARLETARWLLFRGAWAIDHEKATLHWPAMVKLTLSETLVECALDVLRIFAGAGWLDEEGVATAMRDVIGTLSASGTSDVQLNVIASSLGQAQGRADHDLAAAS